MSGKKSPYPDGRIPDRNPDGTPAVPWRSRWTEGVLPLWLVATDAGNTSCRCLGSSVPGEPGRTAHVFWVGGSIGTVAL